MILTNEVKEGFDCTFQFQCTACGVKQEVASRPRTETSANTNEGITSIGLGFYHLEKYFSHLNVPVMCQTTFD